MTSLKLRNQFPKSERRQRLGVVWRIRAALLTAMFLNLLALEPLSAAPELTTNVAAPVMAPRPKEAVFQLGLMRESLLNHEAPSVAQADDTRASIRVSSRSRPGPGFGFGLDAGGSFSAFDGKENNIEVPQIYASLLWRSDVTRQSVSIGRKQIKWSTLDRDWNLGVSEPLNRYDGLRTTLQGLTGVFYALRTGGGIEVTVFASPIFIPEQGAGFELSDGRFRTRNPWFSEPTDRLILFSKETQMRYSIEMPSTGSVVAHPSAGFMLNWSPSDGGDTQPSSRQNFKFAYLKKPRNQLSLPFDAYYDLASKQARVSLYPQVAYHNLASLEFQHRAHGWTSGIATLAEVADQESFRSGVTYQEFEPLYMLSPSVETNVTARLQVKAAALASIGGRTSIEGPLKTDQSPFAPRTMYRQAASLEARSSVLETNDGRVEARVKWIEEFSENGTVFLTDMAYVARNAWRVGVYVDILASRRDENSNPGFISRFRGNDRAGVEFVYSF